MNAPYCRICGSRNKAAEDRYCSGCSISIRRADLTVTKPKPAGTPYLMALARVVASVRSGR